MWTSFHFEILFIVSGILLSIDHRQTLGGGLSYTRDLLRQMNRKITSTSRKVRKSFLEGHARITIHACKVWGIRHTNLLGNNQLIGNAMLSCTFQLILVARQT